MHPNYNLFRENALSAKITRFITSFPPSHLSSSNKGCSIRRLSPGHCCCWCLGVTECVCEAGHLFVPLYHCSVSHPTPQHDFFCNKIFNNLFAQPPARPVVFHEDCTASLLPTWPLGTFSDPGLVWDRLWKSHSKKSPPRENLKPRDVPKANPRVQPEGLPS